MTLIERLHQLRIQIAIHRAKLKLEKILQQHVKRQNIIDELKQVSGATDESLRNSRSQ
jgi:hypothetical protein